MDKKIALIPGSFDPPTRAHAHIWKRLAEIFHLVIAIGVNPGKSKSLLLPQTRAALIKRVLEDERIEAEVVVYNDLLDVCAKRERVDLVIRGLRGVEDLATENAVQDYLDRQEGPPVLSMSAPAHLRACSSTFVRGLLPFADEGTDHDLETLLPKPVWEFLRHRETISALREKFSRLWQDLGARGESDPAFEHLLVNYSEPRRAYHTIEHLAWGLHHLGEMRAQAANLVNLEWNAVFYAMWFHDAVMEFKELDEAKSAELARAVAYEAALPVAFADRAARMILATRHGEMPSDPESAALVDADLSILGTSGSAFDRYEEDIRKEWQMVPQNVFATRRAEILQGFLDRESIFATSYGRTRWEVQARTNLARSIAKLRESMT